MQKKLRITIQDKINNFLYNAYFLSAILAYDNFYPWFYENYVQLFFNGNKPGKYGNEVWLDFYGSFIEVQKLLSFEDINRNIFEKIDIIGYIEDNINNNKYIYTYFDESLFKPMNKTSYLYPIDDIQAEHYIHDILIYGYDQTAKRIAVLGFDNQNKFTSYEIDYDKFKSAFESGITVSKNDKRWDEYNGVYGILFEVKNVNDFDYKFNISVFLEHLHEYIYSINSFNKQNDFIDSGYSHMYKLKDNIFGMDIYDHIIAYMENNKKNDSTLDYRIFHTFYEQKLSILDRLNYINTIYSNSTGFDNLISQFEEIFKAFKNARYHIIMYNISKKKNLLDKVISIFSMNKNKEKILLTNIYEYLKSSKSEP
jgi:hypothetical protein